MIARHRKLFYEHVDAWKSFARWKAYHAFKSGKLQRSPCEVCGRKSEMHHPDYGQPLTVRWLCRTHHHALHVFELNPEKVDFIQWAKERDKVRARNHYTPGVFFQGRWMNPIYRRRLSL